MTIHRNLRRFSGISAIMIAAAFLVLFRFGVFADSDVQELHPIWLIENQSNRVYLVGSIHVLRKQDYPLPTVFEEVYTDAERIVLEIALESIQPQEAASITQSLALLPDNQTLETVLGVEQYRALSQRARGANIDLRQFKNFEPWFAALSIAQIQMQRLGFEADRGIDFYLSQKAHKDDKIEIGLESLKQQLGFMDQLPMSAQIQLLGDSLVSLEELKRESHELIKAWEQGDLLKLDQLFALDLQNNPALKNAILIERNKRWLPKIEGFIDQPDDYLVVTGALHLAGEEGLIHLLRKQGYKIRQL